MKEIKAVIQPARLPRLREAFRGQVRALNHL